jgi:hypothetical protein
MRFAFEAMTRRSDFTVFHVISDRINSKRTEPDEEQPVTAINFVTRC